MGQSSSTDVRARKHPPRNLLLDASDSYVTNVQLKRTPISEYIKKDKYNKTVQKLKESHEKNKESLKVIHKAQFIDISGSDIPEDRKCICKRHEINTSSKKLKVPNQTESVSKSHEKNVSINDSNHKKPNQILSTHMRSCPRKQCINHNPHKEQCKASNHSCYQTPDSRSLNYMSDKTGEQLYKNEMRACCSKRHYEDSKMQKPVNSKTNSCSKDRPNTNGCKSKIKCEESSHRFNRYHSSIKPQNLKKYHRDFVMETHISCSIPPKIELSPSKHRLCKHHSKELAYQNNSHYKDLVQELKTKLTMKKPENQQAFHISPTVSSTKLEFVTKQHRQNFSAKQALENWKNIHTLRQHRKQQSNNSGPEKQSEIEIIMSPNSKYGSSSESSPVSYRRSDNPRYRPEFTSTIEKCLQQHIRRAALFTEPKVDKKSTWVQDVNRKWHKVNLDNY